MLLEVFACTHAASTGYVMQARDHSGPEKDIACRVDVSIGRKATLMAFMTSVPPLLWDPGAA